MNLSQLFRSRRRGVTLVPLVDVVFILLLFFLLSSSFIQKRQVSMDLPAIAAVASNVAVIDLQLLSNDGRLRINGQEFLAFDISSISTASVRDSDHTIAIQSDQEVKLQALITLLDRLSNVGFDKIALVE